MIIGIVIRIGIKSNDFKEEGCIKGSQELRLRLCITNYQEGRHYMISSS